MSNINVVWTAGAEQALKDNPDLINKVGGGDLDKAKKWHENKVSSFAGSTATLHDATKSSIRCVSSICASL